MRSAVAASVGLVALACAPAPLEATATVEDNAVSVHGNRPGFAVELVDATGLPLVRGRAPAGSEALALPLPAGTAGRVTARVTDEGQTAEVALDLGDASELRLEVQAPLGGPSVPVGADGLVDFIRVEGQEVSVGLRVRAPAGDPLRVSSGPMLGTSADPRGSVVERGTVPGGEARLFVESLSGDEAYTAFTVDRLYADSAVGPTVLVRANDRPLADLAKEVTITDVVFPATETGARDLVRPADRVTLPSPWWRDVLDHSLLGVRARDEFTAWAWTAVRLGNTGATPVDVVVRSRVLGPDGQPDRAFRPRVRSADDGTGNTSVLLRVPPGGASATLPLYVEEGGLGAGPWTRVIEVMPVGARTPLVRDEAPLFVSRSSSWVAAGLVVTLSASIAGIVMVLGRARRWLREMDTAALVTVALFASLSFVVGTVGQLFGLGAAAAAGPFAILVTGIVDDALQATLIGALVTVLPRPGAATLSVLVAWLLRGIATGTLSPMDVAFVSCRIATLEGGLWFAGLTRGRAWREAPRWQRVLRLGLGLSVGSLAGTAASLVLHSALFRLYFAPWYVGMVLAGPGFLYVLAAAGVADTVATQLRRVED